MTHQVALTVHAPLAPTRDVAAALAALAAVTGPGKGEFAELGPTHFARVFVLPADETLGIADSLVYMADVDAPEDAHLRRLSELGDGPLAAVLACWRGYPGEVGDRLAWLREHRAPPAAAYVHQVGRDLERVHAEAGLRREVGDFLDAHDWDGHTDVAVHRAVRAFVRSREDLRWALEPAAPPGPAFRAAETLHAVALPVVGALALPLALPVLPWWWALIRLLEQYEVPESAPADPVATARLTALEERATQNPFTAAGRVRANVVRRTTIRAVLVALDYACRHVYHHEHLRGVRSIHFARWVPVDGGRRLIFASSYDGSQESYMDDFIDRLAWGINAVFGNGEGFPSTRWLFFGGAQDEQAFKNYLRLHQIPAVWFSAYPHLPARGIDDDTRLRRGLCRDLGPAAAQDWLARV